MAGKKGRSGPKSRYSQGMLIAAEHMAKAGMVDRDIGKELGISESTFSKWKREHPEFVDALKRGKKSGRYSRQKFTPGIVLAAEFMARIGMIDKDMAAKIGIHESTFHKWKKDYPEFAEALRRGKEEPNEKVISALYRRALGYAHPEDKIMHYMGEPVIVPTIKHYPPDTSAIIFWLCNRLAEDWRQKNEVMNTFGDAAKELAEAIKKI